MYKLYFSPGTSSMAPHAVLEELAVPYTLERVTFEDGKIVDPEFVKINPTGKVPALVIDGFVVSESAAICMFLADRHPAAGLAPPITDLQRGAYYQWMCFLTNTMQVAFMRYYFSARYSTSIEDAEAIQAKAAEDLTGGWRIIERQLASGPYLLGTAPSTCDLFLYMLYAWLEAPLDTAAHPNLGRWAELIRSRPSIERVAAQNEAG